MWRWSNFCNRQSQISVCWYDKSFFLTHVLIQLVIIHSDSGSVNLMALPLESRVKDRMLRIVQKVLGAGSESDTFYSCLHHVGQHAVTWQQLSAREPGNCGLSMWCRRKLDTDYVPTRGGPEVPLLLTADLFWFFMSPWKEGTFQFWSLSFPWGAILCHQSGFLKDHFFFLISAGSCNLLFSSVSLSQPNHFFIYSPRIPSPYSHHCWENSCYLEWITQFFPPCPNYMFLVHNSPLLIIFLSHEDVMSPCPTGTHPWGRSAHYQGQGHKWITKRSTIVNRNLMWRAILLRPWNTIFPICS